MAIAANSNILQIVRAGTVHEIGLERFLTPEMRSIIAPSHPESVMICQHLPEHEYDETALCIYDSSRTVSREEIHSSFLYNDADEFAEFKELAAPNGKLYAPIFYYNANPINDEMYYDGLVELAEQMRGRGIAKCFYVALETILRECGFRFLGGWHDNENAAIFFVRGGRRFLEEMIDGSHRDALANPEGKEALLDPVSAGMMIGSVRCFDSDDEVALVKPEFRDATLDQRLSLLKRVMSAKTLFLNMRNGLPEAENIKATHEILNALRGRSIDVPQQIPTATEHYLALLSHTYDIVTRFTQRELDGFNSKFKKRLA